MLDLLRIKLAMKTGWGAQAAIEAAKRTTAKQHAEYPWLRVLAGHTGTNYNQTIVEARRYRDWHG